MRISLAAQVLEHAIQARISAMLWGSPGIGKSDTVRQLAAKLGIKLIDLRLSQLDPVDLRGIPMIDKNGEKQPITRWTLPDFLPNEKRDGPIGILFLDEINNAGQAMQASGYQLVLDRRLGDYVLPEGWAVVAAGNNEGDRAIVNKMATPLRNRFMHIDVDTHIDDFREYGFRKQLAEEVIGFVSFKSKCLNMFEDKDARNEKAFATPRTWEMVSRVLKSTGGKTNLEIEFALISGLVGTGVASEFKAFLRCHRDLPDINKLLLNPEKAKIPTDPMVLYALTTTLAMRATVENFAQIMKFINRLPQAEFQVLTVQSAAMKDSAVSDTPEFNEWAIKNAEVIA